MFNLLKTTAVAAVVVAAPLAASAAVIEINDGDTVSINGVDAYVGTIDNTGGAGDWTVTFESEFDPFLRHRFGDHRHAEPGRSSPT